MTFISQALGILAAGLTLIVVFEMLRRGRLKERHALWWLVAGFLALIVGVFPEILISISDIAGIEIPTNLIFFVSIAVLFLVCIQNSSELTSLEEKTRVLAEQVAILRNQVDSLSQGKETPKSPTDKS